MHRGYAGEASPGLLRACCQLLEVFCDVVLNCFYLRYDLRHETLVCQLVANSAMQCAFDTALVLVVVIHICLNMRGSHMGHGVNLLRQL